MLGKIARNNRLLLTGILLQQLEEEKLKARKEKSFWEQVKESTNVLGVNILSFGRNVKEEESSTPRHAKEEFNAQINKWDRVKTAFLVGVKDLGPELSFAIDLTGCGFACGFLYGGMRDYVKAINLFLYSNDTTKFFNVKEARVALINASLKGFFKGALLTAPKCSALCGIFGVSNAALTLYNGKSGILEFSLAGAVTTGIMKWNLGIRGMISGCVSGGLSGLLLGSVISILLLPTGKSFSDFQLLFYNIKKSKNDLIFENEKLNSRSEIEKYHSEKTKDMPVAFSDK